MVAFRGISMPSRRPLFPLVLSLLLLAGLGGLAWWWLQDHGAEPPVVRVDRAGPDSAPEANALASPGDARPDARPERSTLAPPPPPSSLDIDPRPPPESFVRELAGLRGRVVEESGAPVPGKKVELLKIRPDLLTVVMEGGFAEPPPELVKLDVASGETAEDGTFLLKDVEVVASIALLGVDLGGPRGTLRLVDASFERGQVCDLGDVVLPAHVTFTGTVVDEDGAPIAGARVRVIPPLPVPVPMQAVDIGVQDVRTDCAAIGIAEQQIRFTVPMPPWLRAGFDRFPLPTAQSGSDGRFQLPGVPNGVVTLLVDRKDFLGIVKVGLPTGRRETQDVGKLYLSKGRRVTGQALAGETPVVGARVLVGTRVALPIPGAEDQVMVAVGHPAGPTDAEGRFALEGLPINGAVLCSIQPRAGDPWTVLGPFDADDVKLELPPVSTLTVLVNDPAGKPVERAELRFQVDSPVNELPILGPPCTLKERVSEQGGGRYLVTDLSLGKWIVLARASGFGVCQQPIELPAEGAIVTLQLTEPRTVQVIALDAATNQPVDYALVTAMHDIRNFLPMPLKAARTNAEGKATLEQLPAGASLKIRVSHPGYATSAGDVPKEAVAEPLRVPLFRGGDLVGRVTQGGEPPARALMLILDPRGKSELPEQEMPRFAITDADGAFRIRHLRAGEWSWNVFSRFFANEPVKLVATAMAEPDELARGKCQIEEGKETRIDIEALPEGAIAPAALHGRVRVDGAPVEGLEVRLMGRRWLDTKTDSGGRFEFANVKPGEYRMEIAQEKPGKPGSGRTTLHHATLSIAPGEQKDLDVDVRTIATTIQVRTSDGAPAAGTALALVLEARGAVSTDDGDYPIFAMQASNGRTDADGRVTLPLRTGTWRVSARHDELGLGRASFEIGDRPIEPVVITLEMGHRVAGRVRAELALDPEEEDDSWGGQLQPAGEKSEEAGWSESNWTEIDGKERRFEFKMVASGRYRLIVWAGRRGRLVSDEFEVGRGDAADLDLRLMKDGE
jgi:hypothetical protein